jgi:hypothetical protein
VETGAMGREIESRQEIHRVVAYFMTQIAKQLLLQKDSPKLFLYRLVKFNIFNKVEAA